MRTLGGLLCMILCMLLCGCANEIKPQSSPTSTSVPTEVPEATLAAVPTEAPTELAVYSQLSCFYGEQQGWFAKVMLDKFNVKLQIHMDAETSRKEAADIIIFGSAGEQYKQAAAKGKLLDWEENQLLEEHGAYIQEHMKRALEYNRSLTPELGKVFGFGNSVASSVDSVEDFIYTWDIRWDLYQQLGYPKVENLEDFTELLKQMKALCPLDETGEEVYAMSLWQDWDTGMVMNVKSMASAYYGYDELGLGLYDTTTGEFYGALEEQGPYVTMLRFFNRLYREGLLDPASATQTYEEASVKVQNGGVLFSVYNYAGHLTYNTENHVKENYYMASLLPEEATPAAYGMNVFGGNRIWTISAETEYAELCMEIINWLCTPEGKMVSIYGPQGVIWDYDAEGNTYFTEFGKECMEEGSTKMPEEYGGGCYVDGFSQINNVTWSVNAENPQSNGETYNFHSWKSMVEEPVCDMEKDWREYTGALTNFEYLKNRNYVVVPATAYKESEKSTELEQCWKKVADCIIKGSWNAIYADSDWAFEAILSGVRSQAMAYGYEECRNWCEQEAAKRYALEEAARK